MIRHLLKLLWHRKRANALVLVEIFVSFLVVFAVATLGAYLWTNYQRPLGFVADDVWSVTVDAGQPTGDMPTAQRMETFSRVLEEAKRLDRIEEAAGTLVVPYSEGSWGGEVVGDPGRPPVSIEFNEVTDAFAEVFELELVAGRWFEPADDALGWRPVVLDLEATHALFGAGFAAEDAVGRWLQNDPEDPRRRVVGVVRDFRQHGELSGPQPYMFRRTRLGDARSRTPHSLVLRMLPGTPAAYEESVTDRLHGVAPEWTFTVNSLPVLRQSNLRLRLMPLTVVAVIAGFLMVMVGLGLMGVLWQNVVQRTREIGLRRASGASRGDVHRQVIAELLLVTTVALALGTLLIVQLPILELFPAVGGGVFTAGLIASVALLLSLAAACALYPSWMAGRVQPAEALRWE